MIFFDTNVLIYALIEQDKAKQKASLDVIQNSLENGLLSISSLVLGEFIYVASRIGMPRNMLQENVLLYKDLIIHDISKELIWEAYILSDQISMHRNINDLIHLKFAEKFCDKIVTFDQDFMKFKPYSSIEIQIL